MNAALRCPGLWTFMRWEWTLQARTLRFRLAVGLYLLTVPLPAVALMVVGERAFGAPPGPASYLVWTQQIQVLLSVVLACALAGNRSDRTSRDEMWPVLSASPLSNAGYGLRRSLAVALLLLPVTALGTLAAAAVAAAAGEVPAAPLRWLVTWFLLIYLPAAVSATAWLTLVSATGSEMVAAILALAMLEAGGALSTRLADAWGRPLGLDAGALGFEGFRWAGFLLAGAFHRKGLWFGGIASEAPIDPVEFVGRWWIADGVFLSLTLVVGLALPLWLGRTRRDLPPLRLPTDHWLRTLAPKVYGALQRLVPDAGLRELRWLPALVLLPAALVVAGDWRRADWALDLGQRRFDAELAGGELAPTDEAVSTAAWHSEGVVSRQGVELDWRAEFRVGAGSVPGAAASTLHLAFTLDPFLEPSDLELRSADGVSFTASQERRWDRWLVDVEPRPTAGSRLVMRARLHGRPGAVHFALAERYSDASFSQRFDDYRRRGYAWRFSDPADSYFVPALSARRVDLRAESLGPVPRHSSWELAPKPESLREPGWQVPEEAASFAADLSIDLTLVAETLLDDIAALGQPDLTLASSCGGLSMTTGVAGSSRLVDSCRAPVNQLRVLGGRWVLLGDEPVRAAALPRHRERLASMLPELRRTVEASASAWPGYRGIDRLAVVEEVPDFDLSGRGGLLSGWEWDRPDPFGHLVAFREHLLLLGEGQLDTSVLLDSMLGGEVATSRRLEPDQRYALRAFLAGLMKLRMGVAPTSAVVGERMPPWFVDQLRVPILQLRSYHRTALTYKVPAVVLQIQRRLGMDVVVAGVAQLLARDTDEPATFEELFQDLEAVSGEDLNGIYQDYFVTGSLPELALADVNAVADQSSWRVSGAVENLAAGSAQCPVVLRTEGPELRRTVVVPSAGRVEFSFTVATRPQLVQLDPEGQCLRLFGGGGVHAERVALQR